MKLTKGRIPSLLAWGLLVGGVAVLITFPEVDTDGGLFIGAIPAALLFVLAGLVFGLSHPTGKDWIGALLLGWVPAVAAAVSLVTDAAAPAVLPPVVIMVAPAVLAAAGAGIGAAVARWRGREAPEA
jgi:hypothetical protein